MEGSVLFSRPPLSSLASSLSSLPPDLSLWVGGEEVAVHRAVLAAASTTLRPLLSRHVDAVILPDYSKETLQAVVRYMYGGVAEVGGGQAQPLLHLATTLGVQGVQALQGVQGVHDHMEYGGPGEERGGLKMEPVSQEDGLEAYMALEQPTNLQEATLAEEDYPPSFPPFPRAGYTPTNQPTQYGHRPINQTTQYRHRPTSEPTIEPTSEPAQPNEPKENSKIKEEFTYGLNPTFSETVPKEQIAEMISRVKDEEGGILYSCTSCSKTCRARGLNNLRQHVQTHLSLSLQCSVCLREGTKGRYMHNNYSTENALRSHKKRVHASFMENY